MSSTGDVCVGYLCSNFEVRAQALEPCERLTEKKTGVDAPYVGDFWLAYFFFQRRSNSRDRPNAMNDIIIPCKKGRWTFSSIFGHSIAGQNFWRRVPWQITVWETNTNNYWCYNHTCCIQCIGGILLEFRENLYSLGGHYFRLQSFLGPPN